MLSRGLLLYSPRAPAAKTRLQVLVSLAGASCVSLRDGSACVRLRDRTASHWRLTGARSMSLPTCSAYQGGSHVATAGSRPFRAGLPGYGGKFQNCVRLRETVFCCPYWSRLYKVPYRTRVSLLDSAILPYLRAIAGQIASLKLARIGR